MYTYIFVYKPNTQYRPSYKERNFAKILPLYWPLMRRSVAQACKPLHLLSKISMPVAKSLNAVGSLDIKLANSVSQQKWQTRAKGVGGWTKPT